MKAVLVLLAVLTLTGSATAPALAAKGDRYIGFEYGLSAPIGDFADEVESGFHVGGTATYFSSDRVGVGVDVVYHQWGGSREVRSLLGGLTLSNANLQLQAYQTTAHGICDILGKGAARPYLEFGCGLYWMRTELTIGQGTSRTDWEPHAAYLMGAGIDFKSSGPIAVGVGGTFQIINGDHGDAQYFAVGLHVKGGR